jgi:putative redox protein
VAKPPAIADLRWAGELTFEVTLPNSAFILDSRGVAGPSPIDALAAALAGCMSVDIADILLKGRHALRGVRAQLTADRAPETPHRFVRIALDFTIDGTVPAGAVERAIALSRDKYCSVWHTMRQDIPFTISWKNSRVPSAGAASP